MLFLILLGIVVGPVLGIFNSDQISSLAPYISALALSFILMDGGISMNIRQAISTGPRAILLAILGFTLSTLVVAGFMIAFYQVSILYGLLFGSIFGGSSSIVVISLAQKIKITEKCSLTLILESAVTDILCIVISLAFISALVTGQADVGVVAGGIALKFLIGAGIGLVAGVIWLFVLRGIRSLSFSYMLTLAIVLLAYASSESLGGSGALSALLFGLILGNETDIFRLFRQKIYLSASKYVDQGLKRFESEIAFFIRTFFFVFLGLIFTVKDVSLVFLGVIFSLILLLVRFGAVYVATFRCDLEKERSIMSVILTRGLAAAVLATLPAQYGLQYAPVFVNLAVVIIISTAIIATVGAILLSRQAQKPIQGKNKS
jgi:cell volume regulation protein A